jgi:hypothetical protein
VIIDQFDATSHLRGRQRTYRAIREAVLAAGRFSVFEVGDTDAGIFDSLAHDPTLIVGGGEYPWVHVRRRRARRA